ncbi:MAG: putative transporter, MFS-type [Thermoleophilia bacterium]|nr:putative transporter, MFS-type [Thermoleophilia bacterium]
MVQNSPTSVADATPAPSSTEHLLPSLRRGWIAVATVMTVAFVSVTTEFLPVGLLDDVGAAMGSSPGVTGLMITIPAIVAAIAAPAVMVGAGKLDRKRVLLGLTLVLVLSNVLVGTAQSLTQLFIGRALLGVVVGGFWSVALSVPSKLVPERSVARGASIIFAGVSLATVVGVPIGTFVGDAVGWRAAFLGSAGVAALVFLVQLWLLPSLTAERGVQVRDLPRVFRTQRGRVGLVAAVAIVIGHFAAYTYVQPFLSDVAHVSDHGIGLLLFVFGGAGALGNLVAGALVTRSLRWSMVGAFGAIALPLLAIGLLGAGAGSATVAIAIWGLGFGGTPMLLTMWMASAVPEAPEAASSMFVSVFQVGISTGSLVGGVIVNGGSAQTVMVVGGVLGLIGAATIGSFGAERALTPAHSSPVLAGGGSSSIAPAASVAASGACVDC